MEDDVIQRKKTWLLRYRKELGKVDRLSNKLETLEERILSIRSPSLSGMPRGCTPVTVADLIGDKMELEDRVTRAKKTARSYKREILSAIDNIEDSKYADVLEAHFVDIESIEEIAESRGYTVRYMYSLYKQAVSVIEIPGLEAKDTPLGV